VEETIRTVAAQEALPLLGRLADTDIAQKTGPLDLVTVADRRVEERLTQALTALLPGSLVIGEEAVHHAPGVLDALLGDTPVWIIDPIDGTSNFVRGEPSFAILVTLARGGEPLASWTYQPVPARMAVARRGEGALLDGAPVRTRGGADDDVLLVASARPANLTAEQRSRFYGLGPEHGVKACASGSAGCDYLDVARGELDAVSYVYDNPWDHSAGILLVAEAGGSVLSTGGDPFRMAAGPLPFVAARDEATARRVLGLMAG